MAVTTYTVGAGTLTIGASGDLTNFSSQVTSVKLTASSDIGDTIYVLSGESVAGDFSETYQLEGTMLQDLGALASVTEWLFNQSGETHVFEFIPSTAAGRTITGSLVVSSPAEIGGDVRTKPLTDFTFTVVGKPVIEAVV
jgi:hypothetical protein